MPRRVANTPGRGTRLPAAEAEEEEELPNEIQEDGMNPNPRRTVDELATDLDDLTTTVEELEIDPAVEPDSANLQKLQRALEAGASNWHV
jgi:hypothetical protein